MRSALNWQPWSETGSSSSRAGVASLYTLTPAAEELFPKTHGPLLRQLLEELAEYLSAEEAEAVLRSTGRHLAA